QGGMKLIAAAKQHDPLIMVILFTAKEKVLDRSHALELGAFDCIEKNRAEDAAIEEIAIKAKVALRFRALALGEIDNQKQLATLARYFDPHILDAVRSNSALVKPQIRFVTLVFWDIRGFSQLCEDLKSSPELVYGFLVAYYKLASDAIFNNAGILDKFIGDG